MGVNITTSADVYVFGHNNVNGIINAVELVDVAALRAMDVQITTAGKAEVYSLENAKVVGDADSGFSIVSDGALEVDANSPDGDVITWSLEQTTGTIDAGGYADSVSWGLTDLESEGDEGAFAWSYGNLSGKLTSSLGYAVGVSLWNNDADYSSETVSAALAGGNVSGMVFSWGDAEVFAGGNVTSVVVTAVDGSAIVMSFGNVNSHVSTGDLAIVFAALDISGVVDGEYAALAFAGQNLEATVKSDGSVWLALAGGNISGAITGDVSVNDVFAYGNISSTIKAGSESSSNGIVESVEAIGTISGQIIATSSIGSVRSGSTVTATLTAPSKPTPIENDAGVAAENPPLEPWDSGMTEIRADLATRRADWVSKRDDARISRDQDVSKNNDSRQAELNRISDGRIERFREGTSIIEKNVAASREAKQSFVAFVKQHRDEQTKSDHALEERFEKDRRDETEARDLAIQNAAEAFHTSFVEWTQEKDRIVELKSQFADRAQKQQQDLEADQQAFEAAAPTMMNKVVSWLQWAQSRVLIFDGIYSDVSGLLESQAQTGTQLGEVLGADGTVDGADYATIIGYGIGDMLVAVKAYKAWEGVDPLTGIALSDNDRAMSAALATLEFAGAVASGLSIAGGFRTKCPGDYCFVGETPIIIGQHNSGPVLGQHLPIETGNNSAFAVLCLIVGAMSGIAVLRDEKRSKRLTAARPPKLETIPDHANAGTDLAFSDSVDLMQGVPETATGPVDRYSKNGLVPGNRVIADSTSERTSESDVSSVLTASGTNSVGKSVRTTTLKAIAVVSLLLSAWFGLNRPAIDSAAMSPAVAEMTAELAVQSPRWDSVTIREIQPAGYKVLADNPQTPGQAPSDFGEFDSNTWQVHRFLISKPNGGWLKIGLARPLAWIESVERNDSGQVWLEFEELGIADWATLQATEPCPSDILGEGRLVTGTFEHSSGEVLNLFIAGEATPIGSTANHPFWSEDRQDFVQAGSLNPGEHLRLADGRTTTLERTEPIAEQLPVYNLEVDGEHVYFVGESGVLVHNAGKEYPFVRYGSKLEADRSKLRNGLDLDSTKNGKFKNVGDPGAVNPNKLGAKNKTDFSHKMEFSLRPGARDWLRRKGLEPPLGHGPNTWQIPANLVDEFNRLFVESVKVTPR